MALDGRQRESRYVVLGLTTGSIFWVVLSLAGMSTLMAHHPWLASAVRFLGASYLVWYGASLLWRAVARPVKTAAGSARRAPAGTRRDACGAYRAGLLTGITNPKGAAFWTSVFATLVPAQAAGWFYPATILMVAVLSLLWHFGITVVFGAEANPCALPARGALGRWRGRRHAGHARRAADRRSLASQAAAVSGSFATTLISKSKP